MSLGLVVRRVLLIGTTEIGRDFCLLLTIRMILIADELSPFSRWNSSRNNIEIIEVGNVGVCLLTSFGFDTYHEPSDLFVSFPGGWNIHDFCSWKTFKNLLSKD